MASEQRPAADDKKNPARAGARERILDAAYALFSRHGVRAVGVDRIIAESGVAKMSLYRHFASKDQLVVSFLDLRGERWTRNWLIAEVERLATTPRERLLAIFDALDGWFRRSDFEGCSFINTLLEFGDEQGPVHRAAVEQLGTIHTVMRSYAEDAGLTDPERVADQLQILMMGAIVSAGRGEQDAARRARELAELLVHPAA